MSARVCEACGSPETDDMICPACGAVDRYVMAVAAEPDPPEPESAPPPAADAVSPSVPEPAPASAREAAPPSGAGAPPSGGAEHFAYVFAATGRQVALAPGARAVLGRDPNMSDVARLLEADEFVSRRHATIGTEPDGRPWIRDEYSTHGTFVNNERLPVGGSRPLHHNDRVRMGDTFLRIVRTAPPRQENDHDQVT